MRVVVLAGLVGCGAFDEPDESCEIAPIARDLAGAGAIDCGDDQGCAAAALEAGDAFHVGWSEFGIDSEIHKAVASDGVRVLMLHQDTYGGGPWGVDGWECVDPYVQDGEIACTSREPEGNHYQVCGEICAPETCQPQPLPFPG